MKLVEQYLKNAEECRALARAGLPEHRRAIEEVAQTWEKLAADRRKQLERSQNAAAPNTG